MKVKNKKLFISDAKQISIIQQASSEGVSWHD